MRARLALLVVAVPAMVAATPVVERVDVDPSKPVVRLHLSQPVVPGESVAVPARDDRPARVYVDLPGARVGRAKRRIGGAGGVLRVRLGQHDRKTARVVIELATPSIATVNTEGRTVTIELAADVPPPAHAEETPPAPATADVPSPTTVPVERPKAAPAPPITVPPLGAAGRAGTTLAADSR